MPDQLKQITGILPDFPYTTFDAKNSEDKMPTIRTLNVSYNITLPDLHYFGWSQVRLSNKLNRIIEADKLPDNPDTTFYTVHIRCIIIY